MCLRVSLPDNNAAVRRENASREAFTVLEVLVSMGVLVIIVFMVSNMFSQVSTIWTIGSGQAESCNTARSALELMSRELSKAMAGKVDTVVGGAVAAIPFQVLNDAGMKGSGAETFCGNKPDQVRFVSFMGSGSPDDPEYRAVCEIYYYVTQADAVTKRFVLKRGRYKTETVSCYTTSSWLTDVDEGIGFNKDADVVIEDIVDLRFRAYDDAGVFVSNYQRNELPAFLDIYVSVLSESDAIKAAAIASQVDRDAFVVKNARKFSTRVFFQNKYGYNAR